MAHFDYISELKSPSLSLHEDGTMPSPPEIKAYLSRVEQLRQEYLSFLADKDSSLLRACLVEMQEANKVIEKRGFFQLRGDDLVTAVIGGVDGAQSFLELRNIDSGLHTSAQKTIEFIMSLLGESSTEPNQVAEPKEKVEQEDVIRGIKGLAEFLHCSSTKAQAIVNSRILTKTKPVIQYEAGGWKFYKKRLKDFIDKNPDAFSNIKCPH
ncbi:MAG: hypothetical protein K6F06_01385 [Bacteroidales bacterium]|nr:hypothetical protein [Bacteroidales bacterium]